MGNVSSSSSDLATPTSTTSCTSTLSETRRHFSVSPFTYSTFVSITRTSSTKTSSHTSASTRTGEYCTWDWDDESTACTSWTFTVDIPTPFTVPTPTGAYGTTEVSPLFPQYTCTDLLCINSVASEYGYALCFDTSTTDFATPTETWPWPPEDTTTYESPESTLTCDPLFDWDCPSSSVEPTYTWLTGSWPTPTWDTDLWPTETSSDRDSLSGSSLTIEPSVDFTVPESRPTPYATISKHTYSYHTARTSKSSTKSSTSDCGFWDDDCVSDDTGDYSTLVWSSDPWRGHTVSTTIDLPRQSAEVEGRDAVE
ncbi:hypothetical protein F5Y14DRAFT_265596 [Nemania sp. NC0429]|nr:hypothetical protein F5Y14DRAFT_265596 [Nemania sp. NC0429]